MRFDVNITISHKKDRVSAEKTFISHVKLKDLIYVYCVQEWERIWVTQTSMSINSKKIEMLNLIWLQCIGKRESMWRKPLSCNDIPKYLNSDVNLTVKHKPLCCNDIPKFLKSIYQAQTSTLHELPKYFNFNFNLTVLHKKIEWTKSLYSMKCLNSLKLFMLISLFCIRKEKFRVKRIFNCMICTKKIYF